MFVETARSVEKFQKEVTGNEIYCFSCFLRLIPLTRGLLFFMPNSIDLFKDLFGYVKTRLMNWKNLFRNLEIIPASCQQVCCSPNKA